MKARNRFIAGFAILLAVGCGSRQSDSPSSTVDEPPPVASVVIVDWVIERDDGDEPPRTAVSLSLTDETGSTTNESLGEVTGACSEWGPEEIARFPRTLLGLRCFHAGAGTEFRLVRSGGSLVVLRMLTDEQIDDSSFEEFKTVAIPAGAAVRAKK